MIRPDVAPWIEETGRPARVRINTAYVWPLILVAQREVPRDGQAAVLLCNDMVNLKSIAVSALWRVAVFLPPGCPVANSPLEDRVHAAEESYPAFLSEILALDWSRTRRLLILT